MDQGSSLLLSVCVMMLCLLGAARCSNGGEGSCCPEIPPWNLTKTPERNCRRNGTYYRYECATGFVRKAGTSDRIQCQGSTNGDLQWTIPTLTCKRDPKIKTTTQPPSSEETKVQTDPVITTTATAATTSLQTTQCISISASVTTESGSTEPTSAGLQVLSDHTLEVDFEKNTTATGETTTTLTTAEPSNNSTVNHLLSYHKGDSTTTVIAFVSLVLVCALIGIGLLFYRRRRQNNIPPHTPDEGMAMNSATA